MVKKGPFKGRHRNQTGIQERIRSNVVGEADLQPVKGDGAEGAY